MTAQSVYRHSDLNVAVNGSNENEDEFSTHFPFPRLKSPPNYPSLVVDMSGS